MVAATSARYDAPAAARTYGRERVLQRLHVLTYSRTLLTGHYPAQHGVKHTLEADMPADQYPQVELPRNFKNVATVMSAAGYNVVYKGKWHLTSLPVPRLRIRRGRTTCCCIRSITSRGGYDNSWLEARSSRPATVDEDLSTKPSAQRQLLRISQLIGRLNAHGGLRQKCFNAYEETLRPPPAPTGKASTTPTTSSSGSHRRRRTTWCSPTTTGR